MQLRDYQTEAIEAIRRELAEHRSTLLVLPTGCGKTVVFSTLASEWDSPRVLIVAHTEELVNQAANKVKAITGMPACVEQAYRHALSLAWGGAKIVVASAATIYRESRLAGEVFSDPSDFGLVVFDEAHRYVKKNLMAKKIHDHFSKNPACKFLGVTATPDRTDKGGLTYFESIINNLPLSRAINDGWLVPIRQQFGVCKGLDFSRVRVIAGEFNEADLEAVMVEERALHEVAGAILDRCVGKPTLVFAAGIHHAERLAEILYERHGQKATCVHGGNADYPCPPEWRRKRLAEFDRGQKDILIGCDVFYEGYDCLDCDTEILCADGWKRHGQIHPGDMCWSLNRDTDRMELAEVEGVIERPVKAGERMVTLESQHVNVRVTEGHEFHLKYWESRSNHLSKNWKTFSGGDLVNRSEIVLPLSAQADFAGVPLTDDELRLVGWILTDGCMSGGVMTISQSECKHHQIIRDLLGRLGWDFTERLRQPNATTYENAKPCYEFRIPKGTHSGSRKRNGWAYLGDYVNKDISTLLDNMTREQFAIMWEAAMLGNGSRQDGKSGVLWLGRKCQAERLTAMAVVRGFATSTAEDDTPSGGKVWRVAIRDRQFIRILPRDPRATRIQFEWPADDEMVWCVRNRNSTIVIRRHGKVCIVGNCPRILNVVIAKKTKSRMRYAQAVGRGTRILPDVELHPSDAAARRAAIAASPKPHMTVIDLVGASTQLELELPCVADLLLDKPNAAARARAKKNAIDAGGSSNAQEDLDAAVAQLVREDEERKRRAKVVADARFEWANTGGIGTGERRQSMPVSSVHVQGGARPTQPMIDLLRRNGIDPTGMNKAQAAREIARIKNDRNSLPVTDGQAKQLTRLRVRAHNREHASALMDLAAGRGWAGRQLPTARDDWGMDPLPDGKYRAQIVDGNALRYVGSPYRTETECRAFIKRMIAAEHGLKQPAEAVA